VVDNLRAGFEFSCPYIRALRKIMKPTLTNHLMSLGAISDQLIKKTNALKLFKTSSFQKEIFRLNRFYNLYQ
jgi:hypothetical protein